jgi:hypothetical protein
VQPIFSQGMIYAPARDWAEQVITEMSMFPAGRFSVLTDSASQGLKHLRDVGLFSRRAFITVIVLCLDVRFCAWQMPQIPWQMPHRPPKLARRTNGAQSGR